MLTQPPLLAARRITPLLSCAALLFFALLVTGAKATPATAPLRVGVSQGWAMPFACIENEQLLDGIMHDLYAAIGEELKRPVSHVVLPRKRVEQQELAGLIDLSCYANPAWSIQPDAFVWSEPLFPLIDVVFGASVTAPARTVRDLSAKAVISTVLGYHYPALNARFSDGSLTREDTVDQRRVMLKVSAGRTPYGTANSLSLAWYRRSEPQHMLADWQLEIARVGFHCAMPRAGALPPQEVFAAIERLRKAGRIDAMLNRYR